MKTKFKKLVLCSFLPFVMGSSFALEGDNFEQKGVWVKAKKTTNGDSPVTVWKNGQEKYVIPDGGEIFIPFQSSTEWLTMYNGFSHIYGLFGRHTHSGETITCRTMGPTTYDPVKRRSLCFWW